MFKPELFIGALAGAGLVETECKDSGFTNPVNINIKWDSIDVVIHWMGATGISVEFKYAGKSNINEFEMNHNFQFLKKFTEKAEEFKDKIADPELKQFEAEIHVIEVNTYTAYCMAEDEEEARMKFMEQGIEAGSSEIDHSYELSEHGNSLPYDLLGKIGNPVVQVCNIEEVE